MIAQTLKAAAKFALPVLVAALALPAFAEDVTFTTTGTFGCGTVTGICNILAGGSEIQVTNDGNTATITAVGYSYTNLLASSDPNISDVNVMSLPTTATNNGAGTGAVNFTGATFALNIAETSPASISGSLSASITGNVWYTATKGVIEFNAANSTLVLGNITYALDTTDLVTDWKLSNPGNGQGSSTFTAQVTPEPTFMMLTGLGFAGLAFVAYRRRRTV